MTASLPRTVRLVLLVAAVSLAACGKDRTPDEPERPPQPSSPTTTVPVALEPLAEPVACYTGPAGTAGVGVCHGGVQTFPDGPCLGQVVPTPEVCNGRDDDCNGTVDDGLGVVTCGLGACEATAPACVGGKPGPCTPGKPRTETCNGVDDDCDGVVDEGCPCVYVAPSGDDAGAGTAERPLRTIGAGIRRAAGQGQPRRVCVAAGTSCPASFDYAEAVTMVDGVSVSGGYEASGATWTRKGCTTRILAQDERGVSFDASIKTPTALDGFTVLGGDQSQNAAITIAGSTGAVVSNDVVHGGGGEISFGVYVHEGATPRIVRSSIAGGHGTALAAGIQSDHAAPVVQGNCSAFDGADRCVSPGCQSESGFVRGKDGGALGQMSVAVRLEASPGAIVAANAICAEGAFENDGILAFGDATGTVVRGNHVVASQGRQAVGVLLDDCGGAAPWVFDNTRLAARSTGPDNYATGVFVRGDCHARIDSNQLVVGNEGGNAAAVAIACAMRGDVGSRCIIEGNASIVASQIGVPATAIGVRCEGSCARVARNAHITALSGKAAIGMVLQETGTLVDANVIEGGCGVSGTTAILLSNAPARVQNNLVLGSRCPPGRSAPAVIEGIRVVGAPGADEPDLHSNTVLALGAREPCLGRALVFDVAQPGSGSTRRGLVRNNVLDGGVCARTLAVEEVRPGSGPRVLVNNDLRLATPAPAVLYRADGARDLRTVAEIEATPGLQAHGNLATAREAGAGGLDAASPCRNAGTADGAPAYDILGHARPAEGSYDIGALEFVP